MYISSENLSFPQVPSGSVDEVWHLHIQFIRNYQETCQMIRGKTMQHVPAISKEDESQKDEMKNVYAFKI